MDEFLRTENLIFLAPLVVGVVLFLLMSLIGGFDHGDLDTDIHADLHHDLDAGHHLAHDGAEASADGNLSAALGFLGLGKVPLNVILLSGVILWGVAGYSMNLILGYRWFAISVVAATLVSLLGTHKLASLIARYLPGFESYVQSGYHFLGLEGRVLYTIRKSSGAVRIIDSYGHMQDLSCRLAEGQEEIPAGSAVQISHYDESTGTYHVTVTDREGAINTDA